MSNDQLKFWMTCPNCKHVFGVEPRAILQYLNRVLDAKAGGAPSERAGETRDERAPHGGETPPAPEGEPTPRAPYKPPYRKWKR